MPRRARRGRRRGTGVRRVSGDLRTERAVDAARAGAQRVQTAGARSAGRPGARARRAAARLVAEAGAVPGAVRGSAAGFDS